MRHKAIIGLALGGILSLTASAASAATVVVSYNGNVASGTDGIGLFGAAGSSLSGTTFAVNYIFDTSTPGAISSTTPSSDVVYGGSYYGAASPLKMVTIKIGTKSLVMDGNTVSDLGEFNNFSNYYETTAFSTPFTATPSGGTLSYFDAVFGTYLASAISSVQTDIFEQTAQGAMTFTGDPATYAGFFDFYEIGGISTAGKFADGATLQVSVLPSMDAARLQILSLPTPAPEPAMWVMMILGFGGIGAMQRRKARLRVVYAMA